MNKLIVTFILLAFFLSCIEVMFTESGGISTTVLTSAIAESDTDFTTNVRDTSGFEETGYFDIENESIEYNGKTDTTFLHCEHGYNDSIASSHSAGKYLYSPFTSGLNDALGFTVIGADSTAGTLNMLSFPFKFVTNTVPKVVSFDYSYLNTGPMQYVKYVLYAFSVGFIFSMGYLILSALGGVAQSILRL